jgi:hypothetical protein
MTLIRVSITHDVTPVQRDISMKGLPESREEELHLMSLTNHRAPAQQSHEVFGEIIDAAVHTKT